MISDLNPREGAPLLKIAATRMGDFINFWKNISMAGGFLMVFAFGAGRYSVERQ